ESRALSPAGSSTLAEADAADVAGDRAMANAHRQFSAQQFQETRESAASAKQQYEEARAKYDRVPSLKKAPGRVVRVDWTIRTGGEDKEQEAMWVIRVGGRTEQIGCGQKWLNDSHSGGFDLNESIDNSIAIVVGEADCPGEKNCQADGEFALILHFTDGSGNN